MTLENEYLERLESWIKTWELTKTTHRHIFWGRSPNWVKDPRFRNIRDTKIKYINSPGGGGYWILKTEPYTEKPISNPNRKRRRNRCNECNNLIDLDEEFHIPFFHNHDPKQGIHSSIGPLCKECFTKRKGNKD